MFRVTLAPSVKGNFRIEKPVIGLEKGCDIDRDSKDFHFAWILEAYAADCPLVLSNTSCFPEVAHDGGIYFDPYDVDSITEAIERVVTDVHLRSELVNKGRKVLDMYSWDKMAIETAKVYESLK